MSVVKFLEKLFGKRKPISITTKPAKAKDAPVKIDVKSKTKKSKPAIAIKAPKQEEKPAVKIDMPKAEEKPAFTIETPEDREPAPKHELPEHHVPDAEALSQIVAETAKPQPVAKPLKPEPAATIDQVVASLPKKGTIAKSQVIKPGSPKKKTRKTKHDKIIETIAKSKTKAPTKKKSR